jgi:NitT/TauT family transport system permease protein
VRLARVVTPGRLRLLIIVALLALWELLPALGLVPPVIMASLSATIVAGLADARSFADSLLVTLGELALGLVIAYGAGGAAGLLIGSARPLRRTLLPLVSSIYAAPFVIIYPLLTAWTGIGTESKVLFGGFYGFFPMALATAASVQTVDRQLVVAARSMGATPRQILFQVMVPSAIPSLLSGLRLAGALVAIGVVVAEMLASTAGVGFLITQNRTMFKTPEVYFGILLVLVLAGLLDRFVGWVERRSAVWQPRRSTGP